jgi:hypothetical protein
MKTLIAIVALFCAVPQQEMPKPGKEHEALKVFEGDWTLRGQVLHGSEPAAHGDEGHGDVQDGPGRLVLNSDVKSTFMGAPFEGRWTMTYSLFKKKYQASWIDSMMPTSSSPRARSTRRQDLHPEGRRASTCGQALRGALGDRDQDATPHDDVLQTSARRQGAKSGETTYVSEVNRESHRGAPGALHPRQLGKRTRSCSGQRRRRLASAS